MLRIILVYLSSPMTTADTAGTMADKRDHEDVLQLIKEVENKTDNRSQMLDLEAVKVASERGMDTGKVASEREPDRLLQSGLAANDKGGTHVMELLGGATLPAPRESR